MVDVLDQDYTSEAIFQEIDQEEVEIQQLSDELTQLMGSAMALETYGMNPTALAIMQTTGLLSGTSLQAIAVEHYSFDDGNKASTIALESLGDKIKETAAKWSAKVLSVAKNITGKILSVLSPLMTKALGLAKSIGAKAWDKTKAAGRTIKAHPFKTIVTVVGAIVAVATIMAYCGSSLPGGNTTKEAFESFFGKVNEQINKITWFSKPVNSVVTETHNFKIDRVFAPKAASATVESLGWTESAVKQLGAQLDKACSATRHGLSALGQRTIKVMSDVGHGTFNKISQFRKAAPQTVYNMTGSKEAAHATSFALGGIFYGGCISVVFAIYRLVKAIIVGGLKLIISTLGKLTGF